MTTVDWTAIEWSCDGTPVELNHLERQHAVRRLSPRMLTDAMTAWDGRGRLSSQEVARRLGCTVRTVERIKGNLTPAVVGVCPVCRCEMWVAKNIVEAHPDRINVECPMSGRDATPDWSEYTAAVVMWLSRRLRAGDTSGVWEYLGSLPVVRGRELLVAALAAVPDVVDPYEWLTEVSA